jgi:hypothetical protein
MMVDDNQTVANTIVEDTLYLEGDDEEDARRHRTPDNGAVPASPSANEANGSPNNATPDSPDRIPPPRPESPARATTPPPVDKTEPEII